MLWNWDWPMRLGECPAKMHSRRMVTRKKEEKHFDKCTCEYYSGSRKGAHRRRSATEFLPGSIQNVSDLDKDDELGESSTHSDTDGSDVSGSADARMQQARPCGSSCWSRQSVELGKVNALLDGCNHGTASSPAFGSNVVEIDESGMNKTDFSASSENGECVYDILSDGEVSQDEEEAGWEIGSSAPSLSPTRGGHRRTFPPPLSSVATQSYGDKLGKSPGACSGGYCLRSFRCNGRFVLQEVKAPTHKYFRVSREDGRLKLELIDAVNESSGDEEEASGSDSVVEMAAESSCTSKVCAEDACEGSTYSSPVMAYADERTCIASTQLISLDSKAGNSMEGCEDETDVMDAPAKIGGTGKPPLKLAVPDVLSVSAAASESPSSPRFIEIRARYTSPTMKSSWVSPISAF